MIGKVVTGRRVGGLLRYLFGPGRANEHTDPHLAGAWTTPGRVEPAVDAQGRHDVRRLAGLLEAPLHAAPAGVRVPEAPVWHCALRAAPTDRVLSDAEWDDVAREVLHSTGLAPRDDAGACRWVAVRHADDHVHLVVTLARQDGGYVSRFRDYYRVGEACRATEERYDLVRTGARDRTAARRPTRAETEKAARTRQPEPARVTLTREVRHAAAATASEDDFFAALRTAGVLVRPRYSQHTPGQVTGYAVALAADTSVDGGPVWFSGGKLAAALSWPRLRARWEGGTQSSTRGANGRSATAGPSPSPWRAATEAAHAGTAHLSHAVSVIGANPAAAGDVAAATADLLATFARAREGRHGGPLTTAADRYHRAAQEPWAKPAAPSAAGQALRQAARLLAGARPQQRGAAHEVAALLIAVLRLVEAVQQLRAAQHRREQAAAARQAVTYLTAAQMGLQSSRRQPVPRLTPGQLALPVRTRPRFAPPDHPRRTR